MAYQKGILSDSEGFTFLTSRLHRGSDAAKDSFMPPLVNPPHDGGMEKRTAGHDMPLIELQEIVLGDTPEDKDEGIDPNVVWRQRALLAEARVHTLENTVLARDKVILETKAKLTSSEEAKTRFSASADLASQLSNEYRLNSCAPIIAGVKEELKLLPQVHSMLKALGPKMDAFVEIPAMVSSLKEIGETAISRMKAHEDLVNSMGDNGDMETLLCLVNRTVTILEQFGFASGATAVNVPQAIYSLASHDPQAVSRVPAHGPGSSTPQDVSIDHSRSSVSEVCQCGCGQLLQNSASSSLSLHARGGDERSFMVGNRNNNSKNMGLLFPNPPPSLHSNNFLQGHGDNFSSSKFNPGHGTTHVHGHPSLSNLDGSDPRRSDDFSRRDVSNKRRWGDESSRDGRHYKSGGGKRY